MGEIVALWLLGLGCIGFTIGALIVVTMPASLGWRVAGIAGVLAASVVGVGAVVVGLARPMIGFFAAPLLTPTLAALALRGWLRSRRRASRADNANQGQTGA
jgi:hypothetical protein